MVFRATPCSAVTNPRNTTAKLCEALITRGKSIYFELRSVMTIPKWKRAAQDDIERSALDSVRLMIMLSLNIVNFKWLARREQFIPV